MEKFNYDIDTWKVIESYLKEDNYKNLIRHHIDSYNEFTDSKIEQIVKQLNKLVDVVHATDTISADAVTHELGLVKVLVKPAKRAEFLQILDHFDAKTLDVTDDMMVIQLNGASAQIDSFVDMISKFKVLELVRSGKMVMLKGAEST